MDELKKLVDNEFCGYECDIEWLRNQMLCSSGLERFCISVVYRVIYNYRKLVKCEVSKFDFESTLRSYLIIFNTYVTISNYEVTDDNSFDLHKNSNGEIYVNISLPDYVKSEFVYDAYMLNYGENDLIEKKKPVKTNGFIENLTAFKEFKSLDQQLAVTGALRVPDGYTALIAMLTGGGKSLIVQSVAYSGLKGLSIIIVPTISLMLDQMRGAKNVIKSDTDNEIFCYYSGCNTQKIKEALHNETARMLFLSPETLTKNEDLRKEILKANKNGYLKNLIVDEAHIIIEWGSSFRVDFQCLDAFQKELLQDNPKLKTYLLSATFSAKTVEDLKKFYRIENKWIELRFDRLRKEPRFNIIKAKSYLDKLDKLKKFVCLLPHPMIIYVNTPDDADKIQKVLNQFGFSNTRTFTGRTNSNEREKLIKDWVDDEFDLMIATCAFGVGVDKKDVRTVIHLYIPSSANQYYQECGRGGRDNLPCLSVMLYTKDDMQSAFKQSQKVLVTEKILGRWFSMLNSDKAQIGVDKTKIDTSVKPSYNENDEFYSYVNNADVAWNVYVILLLRRNGLLNIDRVEYKDDSYIFYVKILDYRIFSNSDETKQIFDDIRENEKNSIYKECNSMHSMLVNIESRCIAELFNDTYKRTEEYCAGCNAHTGVVNEENERRVIMLPLPNPKLRASTEIVELTNGKPEMMIIADGRIFDAVKLLAEKKVDVIVVPPTLSIDVHSLSKDNEILNVMSYVDFFNLSAGENDFYLSGGIAFVLEGDASQWMRLLTVVKRLNCIAVYICNEDLFISGRNKYLSEMINGTRKNLYVIEGE